MIKKLRVKFVCINMAIVTAMLLVIFSLVIFFMGMGMELQGRQALQQLEKAIMMPGRPGSSRMEVRRPYFSVRIQEDGTVHSYDSAFFEQLDTQTMEDCVHTALEQEKEIGLLREQRLMYRVFDTPFGKALIFADVSQEINTMNNLVRVCMLISLVSYGVFYVIIVLLARWAVKPVERAWNQQKQFVADASHELKTPLTVIMTNAELLQSPDYENEDRQQFALSILTMSRQMRGLVEGLLELARVDNGAVKMAVSRLNFSALVEHGLLPFEPVYFEKGLELTSRVEEDIWVRGSQSYLQQVLDILLDNAAKYSQPGGCVTVVLSRQGRDCLLRVENPGESISREELKHIFERFYRIDKARTMRSSYGLGLSIAQGIVKEHRGKIWADSKDGINTFLVSLPMA